MVTTVLHAYRDAPGWGVRLAQAAARRGLAVHLFESADEVPDRPATVFVHMNHRPAWRDRDKRLMAELSAKRVLTIPTPLEAELYDDKILQYRLLHPYMPASYHLTSVAQAKTVAGFLEYPFISKAATGAASSNVRLIKGRAEAEREIALAFGHGIELHWGQKQSGYLFWQHFCTGNAFDWRVFLIAQKYGAVVKRYNRDDRPFASGSGKLEHVEEIVDDLVVALLNQALKIVRRYGFSLCAMDFVLDAGTIKLLETSSGWPYHMVKNLRVFRHDKGRWHPMPYLMRDLFDIVLDAILAGEFC